MKKERRRTKRLYPMRPIQLVIDCDRQIIGRIHNISDKGASVEYEGTALPCEDPDTDEVLAEIALDRQSQLQVEKIRCEPVYDISTLAHNSTFRGINMRLCGLKFQDLNQTQHSKLNKLLSSIN